MVVKGVLADSGGRRLVLLTGMYHQHLKLVNQEASHLYLPGAASLCRDALTCSHGAEKQPQ